jgi:hypothetical protein
LIGTVSPADELGAADADDAGVLKEHRVSDLLAIDKRVRLLADAFYRQTIIVSRDAGVLFRDFRIPTQSQIGIRPPAYQHGGGLELDDLPVAWATDKLDPQLVL